MNGTSTDVAMLKLDICGAENGQQAAWVNVNRNKSVSFINQQGETSDCVLDNGFKVGSKCNGNSTGSSESRYSTTILTQFPTQMTSSYVCN